MHRVLHSDLPEHECITVILYTKVLLEYTITIRTNTGEEGGGGLRGYIGVVR